MSTRALDSNHDWTFGNGLSDYLTGIEELKQNIKTRLLEWQGDCFFDQNAGVDWINRLGAKGDKKDLLLAEVNGVILETDGVRQITSSSAELDSERKLRLQFTIQTIYGDIDDNINI